MNKTKKISVMFFLIMLIFGVSLVSAEDCNLGETFLEGYGCVAPKFNVDVKSNLQGVTGISSSTLPGQNNIQLIEIESPYAAPGQAVLARITVENTGDTFPFNRISLPPDQYALVLSVDPPESITYRKKQSDGSLKYIDVDPAEFVSKAESVMLFITRAFSDFTVDTDTATNLCKWVDHTEIIPKTSRQRFMWKYYNKEMKAKYGNSLTESSAIGTVETNLGIRLPFFGSAGKITDTDIRCDNAEDTACFPQLYEWDCIKVTDKITFANDVQQEQYCGSSGTVNMGCIGEYIRDNIQSSPLKSTSFIVLTADENIVADEYPDQNSLLKNNECRYSKKDKITYCKVGNDGICPPGLGSACDGKSKYTFDFVMLVPADAPAIGAQDFKELQNSGYISGLQIDKESGDPLNYGYTKSTFCEDEDYSSGCHVLEARVQAINKRSFLEYINSVLGKAAVSTATGGLIGTLFGGLPGGAVIGGVMGTFTFGNGVLNWLQGDEIPVTLIGLPILTARGTFFVVAPALRISAWLVLWLALIAGFSTPVVIMSTARR